MNNDLISRQAAILALIEKGQHSRRYKWGEIWELNGLEIREVLNNLPSVQPEQKTGHWWINPDGYAPYCSECKHDSRTASTYCPNCGAKMEEVK